MLEGILPDKLTINRKIKRNKIRNLPTLEETIEERNLFKLENNKEKREKEE